MNIKDISKGINVPAFCFRGLPTFGTRFTDCNKELPSCSNINPEQTLNNKIRNIYS